METGAVTLAQPARKFWILRNSPNNRPMLDSTINVRHLAHLARLNLTEEETVAFESQLGQVLNYVKTLELLDVSGVEPTAHAAPVFNVFREDEIRESFSESEALANAPRKANDLFIVTKVVE